MSRIGLGVVLCFLVLVLGTAGFLGTVFHNSFSADVLVQDLSDDRIWVRSAARKKLEKMGPKAVPALIDALKNSNETARWEAAYALAEIGPEAKAANGSLVHLMLHDESADVRWKAAQALLETGSRVDFLVPLYRKALADADSSVRELAASALGEFGTAASSALRELEQMLHDELAPQEAARTAILRIKGGAQAVPVLLAVLADDTAGDRQRARAAAALGRIVPPAKATVSALLEATRDDSVVVRRAAREALRSLEAQSIR